MRVVVATFISKRAQLAGTTLHEVEVTSSNSSSPFCVDMSKKKKKKE
jgi:hypothetical protein